MSTGFASWLRYFRKLINGIQQRAPRTFGWAAITLDVGPHLSSLLTFMRVATHLKFIRLLTVYVGADKNQAIDPCKSKRHQCHLPVNFPNCLKPNSITLSGSELAPNMFGASSELVRSWLRRSGAASVMEFGFYQFSNWTVCKFVINRR